MAQKEFCANCWFEGKRIENINGKCEVCSSTDWLNEEDLKLFLNAEEFAYLRNLLDRKSKRIYKELREIDMPDSERERLKEVLEFVTNLKWKIVNFMENNGI